MSANDGTTPMNTFSKQLAAVDDDRLGLVLMGDTLPFDGDDAASTASAAPTSMSLRSGGVASTRPGSPTTLGAAVKSRLRHQREVRKLFADSFAEMELRETTARQALEQTMLMEGLHRLHQEFLREKQVFIEHSQSQTVFQEMMARHRIAQEWEEEFALLYRFVDARLVPVKMEALQILCLQTQAKVWVGQGFERAQLYDLFVVEKEELLSRSVLYKESRWLRKLHQTALQTMDRRKIPRLLDGRQISPEECKLIQSNWRWNDNILQLNTLKAKQRQEIINVMMEDLWLAYGAGRVRIEWEQQEEMEQVVHSGRAFQATLRRAGVAQ